MCFFVGGILWRKVFFLFACFLKIELNYLFPCEHTNEPLKQVVKYQCVNLLCFCPPIVMCRSRSSQCDVIWWWVFWEAVRFNEVMRWGPQNGITAFRRTGREESILSLLHVKMQIGPSTCTEYSSTWSLWKYVWFKLPGLWFLVIAAQIKKQLILGIHLLNIYLVQVLWVTQLNRIVSTLQGLRLYQENTNSYLPKDMCVKLLMKLKDMIWIYSS